MRTSTMAPRFLPTIVICTLLASMSACNTDQEPTKVKPASLPEHQVTKKLDATAQIKLTEPPNAKKTQAQSAERPAPKKEVQPPIQSAPNTQAHATVKPDAKTQPQ